jgi:hypothetical protein
MNSLASVALRCRGRRAAGNIDVDRDEAVNSLEYVVALLERAAGDGTGAHGDDVFWLRHLVIEADDLGCHLFGDRAGDDHEVCLAGGWAEDLGAEAGQVVAGHGGGDHFDGTAGQAKVQRPERTFTAPVIEVLQRGGKDTLLAQLGF